MPSTSAPKNSLEFFCHYWSDLESRGWESAILHSWKHLPDEIQSDVDYVVGGCSPKELLTHLDEYCRENGWRLAQVIEHEPGAYFCNCVQMGGDYHTLALDVTWDYRRLGHSLVPGRVLLKDRRRINGKTFYVVAPGAECAYILAKAAAKDKEFDSVRDRLGELLIEDGEGCADSLAWALGFSCNVAHGPENLLREIEEWFSDAPTFSGVRKGRRLGLAEILLYFRRILRPTGLWVVDRHGLLCKTEKSSAFRSIKALFRRAYDVDRVSVLDLPKALTWVTRTSLLIERSPSRCSLSRWFCVGQDFEALCNNEQGFFGGILEYMATRVSKRIRRMRD